MLAVTRRRAETGSRREKFRGEETGVEYSKMVIKMSLAVEEIAYLQESSSYLLFGGILHQ
jgi:hypothetical protein